MFEKLIDSFEKLCLQIIIEILLVPVTIFKLFQEPRRCYDFSVHEMEKEETERFQDYLSPIKLSVYTSVIISVLLMDYGGEQSFISKIKGLSMVEKALFIFLINNFTAVLFSVILLWYKKEKVNTPTFRTLLFSFIYTTVYTSTPFFLLILSAMFLGQTVNVQAYLGHLEKLETYGARDYAFFIVFLVFTIIGLIGLFKLFKALHYILKENFRYHPYIVWIFTLLFFIIQLYYARGFI
ncbi:MULTISPECIES: hypothetical protein [Chryseobacterium]|jgi:hypothetical protein|uniref:DUF4271 domain-containing protein n=1 Tax=Chryseobacterium rhizosphaerae TaxID=395937 RepID=A0ABX9IID6_9FLAO|nr:MULTISPECIES: hypothetical protein [Chryseobacterium]MDC8100623.1 hypothetical protein [Chryseobacterium rhizosphaerae]MDR6545166.1 hypothetical protein [Chryseobacterium rhizosphaerae]REC73116.1 hypothetical protein DRF57_18175 [Chryseobacterium rhizosphaerae]SMC39884.1 hypothetical protein SAMN02787074_0994 [Chryseobacterium sp. YR221]